MTRPGIGTYVLLTFAFLFMLLAIAHPDVYVYHARNAGVVADFGHGMCVGVEWRPHWAPVDNCG